jgi:hypothetical protein
MQHPPVTHVTPDLFENVAHVSGTAIALHGLISGFASVHVVKLNQPFSQKASAEYECIVQLCTQLLEEMEALRKMLQPV